MKVRTDSEETFANVNIKMYKSDKIKMYNYSKFNPEWVREFIEKNKNGMANLSIREASKYLDK